MRLGLALAMLALTAGPAQAQVVEGESLRGVRAKVVRDALRIAPGGTASRTVRTGPVGSVVVRGRGCMRVSIDGAAPRSRRRFAVSLAPGRHVVRISARRCRAIVDRLRLRAPAVPSPPPVPAPAPAPIARVPLGTSAQLRLVREDSVYENAMLGGFRSLTPENELKMEWTHPQRDEWDFEAGDALVDYATAHGFSVRGHTLIFGAQTPPWVQRELFPSAIEKAMVEQVRTVIGRYKDRIHEWDVVNEAIDNSGHFHTNPFSTAMGERYVDRAFEAARAADPTARLYYNEYNADSAGPKRDAVVRLVARLKGKGLIDGVGLQMHTAVGHAPTKEMLLDTLRLYEGMGLEVQITEMDVDVVSDQDARPLADRLAEQAAIYRDAAAACAEVLACKRMSVWGVTDRYSWLGADRRPLLFDASYQPKPALDGVRLGLGT